MTSFPPLPAGLSRDRLEQFAKSASWYHTLELAPGVVTHASFDHRPVLSRYGLPERLDGWSALDVGTADGFFAFELERRGATVTAVDNNLFDTSVTIDVSPGRRHFYEAKYRRTSEQNAPFADVYQALGVQVGHQLLAVRALLGSRIDYRNLSVYALPSLGTRFDLVFCGSLLEHLKNPLEAAEALAAATRRQCVIATSGIIEPRPAWARALKSLGHRLRWDPVPPDQHVQYLGHEAGGTFFRFAPEALRHALEVSGFDRVVMLPGFDLMELKRGARVAHAIYHGYRS